MIGRKPFIVIMFILSALILNACAQASAKVLDGWKPYVNEKHGYTIMVPSDCLIGRMPSYCKATPPEERPQECLCFLDGENPDQVIFQAFSGEADNLSLATFGFAHYDTPMFNPPAGTGLVEWLQESFTDRGLEIPGEPNATIGGIPAIRIDTPHSPQAPSYSDIYFIKEDLLFKISMIDVENELNNKIYEKLLSSIEFTEQ